MKTTAKLLWAFAALLLISSQAILADDGMADDEDEYEDVVRAQLIVRKSCTPTQLVVQGRNVTVNIDIYNTGSGSAKNVRIADVLPSNAKLLSGSLDATIPTIAEGSIAKHSYTIMFTTGGSGTAMLPAKVTYIAEEGSEQVGSSSFERLFVMTPVQHITRHAVIVGTYVSLGMCRSLADWRNLLIVVGIIGGVVVGNSMFTTMSTAQTSRKRSAALRELEKER
mmetsp:Transcript_7726/g.23204  ORF Transcript_7726/g.23204 Transcript_7726/m.23204 type:complete len:224 (-) Transcript_7726:368-1039(-)